MGNGASPPRPSSTLQINGKKRHILVDTVGLLLTAVVHPADIQDRDGGVLVMSSLFGLFPFLSKLFVDGGYQGPQFRKALAKLRKHPPSTAEFGWRRVVH